MLSTKALRESRHQSRLATALHSIKTDEEWWRGWIRVSPLVMGEDERDAVVGFVVYYFGHGWLCGVIDAG